MSNSPSGWLDAIPRPFTSQKPSVVSVELAEQQSRKQHVDSGSRHSAKASQPMPVQHHSPQDQHGYDSWGGNSGSGLPSALTPAHLPGRHAIEESLVAEVRGLSTSEAQQPLAAQTQQQPDAARASKPQQKVRWLPGLQAEAAESCRPPTSNSQNRDAAVAAATSAALQQHSTAQQIAGAARAGAGAGEPMQQPPMPSSSGGSSTSIGRRSGRLPSSGDEQLDKYLQYLLKEQHPHKFMYYPSWGVTDDGCAAIGEFLRRDRRIKVVTLSGNNITDDGVELIAEGLACNSSLISLDLSNNAISSAGAVVLAEALHSGKSSLAELQLAQNRIGDEGAEALAAAVAGCGCLKKLNLTGNPISSAQLQVVQHVLKTREYKMPSQPRSNSSRSLMRKASSLQFDIELMEGQALERNSSKTLRKDFLHLPPALAVAALTEHMDDLESSISMQAAHLLAEVRSSGEQAAQASSSKPASGDRGSPSCSSHSSASAAQSAAASGAGRDAPNPSKSQASLAALLALRLACRGYDVVLRTCSPVYEPGGAAEQQQAVAGSERVASGLRHTVVRVMQPGPPEETAVLPVVIVDPLFREQFLMPHATERYQSLLDALPGVLCLAEGRLWHLVELLCTEMAAAFKESGLSLPPWREPSAVMDKWLSLKHHDVVVEPETPLKALQQAVAG